LDFKSNLFNWYIFGLSKLYFGMDFDLARSKLSQNNPADVEPSESGSMSDRVVLGPYLAKHVRANFELSVPGPLSSQAFPSRCPAELAWSDVKPS